MTDTIDRLLAVLWEKFGYPDFFEDQPALEPKKDEHRTAMLAVMRELQQIVFERGRGAKRPALERELAELIAEYEQPEG